MSLIIADPKLEAEIRALAALTGEDAAEALAIAVRERKARLAASDLNADPRVIATRALAAGLDMPAPFKTSNHDDMYDELGLPT